MLINIIVPHLINQVLHLQNAPQHHASHYYHQDQLF